ncbi:MAG: LCP family protein, partial [Patescibacteria group bacterium]
VKTVDILGGIDVDIIKSFTDKQYPVAGKENDPCGKSEDEMKEFTDPDKIATDSPELLFPCRFETVEFKAGITHLSGTSALRYARSRHAPEDGGDFNRAQRQQKVLEAFRSKLVSPYFITRIPALYSELKDDVRSSFTFSDIQSFIKQIPQVKSFTLKSIVLSDQNILMQTTSADGQFILVPKKGRYNYAEVQRMIQTELKRKSI